MFFYNIFKNATKYLKIFVNNIFKIATKQLKTFFFFFPEKYSVQPNTDNRLLGGKFWSF